MTNFSRIVQLLDRAESFQISVDVSVDITVISFGGADCRHILVRETLSGPKAVERVGKNGSLGSGKRSRQGCIIDFVL